nr:hypothetical protein [Tanacetum cinerariifolium]
MNRLKVDILTQELLAGPTFELMKGSCKSLVELEYFIEEVYKVTTDQLDWNNPEGQKYPHDLRKPLHLIPIHKNDNSDTSPKKKPVQAPKGKRLKATANVPKLGKKKLPAQGLETFLEITLSETKQIKIATKRIKIQFYSSHASSSGDDDQDDENEQTESDNDGDDFLHPKLSTFDEEERHDEKQDEEKEGSDLRVQTPFHFESTDDEAYDDVTQGTHVIMTAVTPKAQQQSSFVSSGFISNMLNPNPDTANLSELELKKILIDKMERNKSIHGSDQQKTLYKALIDAYESDKVILDTYRDPVMIKRHRDNEDNDEEPSTRSNRGSKRRRARKEPESTSEPKEKTSKSTSKSKEGNLARKDDSFNELMDTPLDFSAFVMNRLKVDTLTPKLLSGPVFKLMKGSCKSLVELKYFLEEVYKATNDQLDWNNPEGRNEDKLYTFKEGDYKRLRLQDIKDIDFQIDFSIQLSIGIGINYMSVPVVYEILELVFVMHPETAKHNVVTPKKPMWKPTGRHFTLYASSPLIRILEPNDEPVELTPSVSSNANLTIESSPSSLAVIQQLRFI